MRTSPPSEPVQLARLDHRQELEINNRHELSRAPSGWTPAEADWTGGDPSRPRSCTKAILDGGGGSTIVREGNRRKWRVTLPSDYLLYNKLRNYRRLQQLHHRLVPIRCRSRQRHQTEIILRVRFDVVQPHLSSLQRSGGSLSSIQLAYPFISILRYRKIRCLNVMFNSVIFSSSIVCCTFPCFLASLILCVSFADDHAFPFRRFSICNTLE